MDHAPAVDSDSNADTRPPEKSKASRRPMRVALLGNPNTGKTTLFNRLCGLRHKTSNFPGTTQEARVGTARIAGTAEPAEFIDLPGTYALDLDVPEARVCRETLAGESGPAALEDRRPDAVVLVVDATNLARNLVLVGEVLRTGVRCVIALNMLGDDPGRAGLRLAGRLAEKVGCPVVPISARTGRGLRRLHEAVAAQVHIGDQVARPPEGSGDETRAWAASIAGALAARAPEESKPRWMADRADAALTHPWVGLLAFGAVMWALFYVVYKVAEHPMGWIEGLFGWLAAVGGSVLPAGILRDLLIDGVLVGVGSTLVFLPQICLLFFLISLLEDTGYLSRAALMADRWLRPFGLSGHAFVPLLSAHACALPAISAARGVPDPKAKLATVLVAPFMSCSARVPVYVLLTVLLFPESPFMQSVAFAGCYVLGIAAGLVSSLLARGTVLRGKTRPLAIELPAYRVPTVRSALVAAWDRGVSFLKKAGTLILAVSIVLWWLGTYPQASEAKPEQKTALEAMGSAAQPVFGPLGYDDQLTVGVLASFAAREVFVSTMAVQVLGDDSVEEITAEDEGMLDRLRRAERSDGGALFTPAVSWSLLVYYVLAMQCLPTVVLTAREAGGWKWALLQLGWMQVLAYGGALVAFQVAGLFGGGGG